MKKLALLAALTTFAAFMPWHAVPALGQGAPRIELDEMRQDLGDISQRETYDYKFSVHNRGNADLVIEKVKPSCGCTVARFDEVIAPGKTGYVYFEILDEKIGAGRFEKKATIHCNDPEHPTMTVSLAGNVLQRVEITPGDRVYLQGMYGEQVGASVTVRSHEKKEDFVITGLASTIDDKITYAFEPAGDPGVYTVHLWKNPKLPIVDTWGSLAINTNCESEPERVVQVNVKTRGAIIAQPTAINFGKITDEGFDSAASKGIEKSLTVFKVRGEFDIRDVEFSSSYYSAKIDPIETGKKYKVTVTFRPVVQKMSYFDEMIVHTDDPNEPSIRVRLVAHGA